MTRLDQLSENISLDEQKKLSSFLSVSTRKQPKAVDAEKQLHVSLALALREHKGQA